MRCTNFGNIVCTINLNVFGFNVGKGRMFRSVGKKFCFPDVPSSWVSRTVEYIQQFQDYRPKNQILFPSGKYMLKYAPKCITQWRYDDGIKDGFMWCKQNYNQLFDFMTPERVDVNKQPPLNKGEAFDIVSMLSMSKGYLVRNNGERVDVESLKGRNILVCCFFVPVCWLSDDGIRGIINAYSKLHNLEMVMVAKMQPNWAHDEDAFNHFFSGFPSSWIAVPFCDALRRDKVCNSLHVFSDPMLLLVDHLQRVVMHETIWESDDKLCFPPFCVPDDWFPYTQLYSLLDTEFVFKIIHNNRANTLTDNNNNNNNNVGGNNNEGVSISVFELEEKLVGLYLCYDGTLIRTLDLVSRECKARNKEFHIVMVYLPYRESVDPLLFQEAINHVLHKFEIDANPYWWVSPFNDFVSRRLWKMAEVYFTNEDQLVILDPKMNIADRLGKFVVNRLGINGYPFTRDSLLRRYLEATRAVTLESLLVYGSRDYVLRISRMNNDDNGDQVPIAELKGKNVLLYIDQVESPSDTYYTLLEWYHRTKTTSVADFEVVFVHSDGKFSTSFKSGKPMSMPMPWLVCPFDPQHSVFLRERLLRAGTYNGKLVAFDKDGHIITFYAKYLLNSFGAEGFPPYDGLHNEMVYHVGHEYDLDMDDLLDFDADAPRRIEASSLENILLHDVFFS